MKMKSSVVWKDSNTRVFTMSGSSGDPDGKDATFMRHGHVRRSRVPPGRQGTDHGPLSARVHATADTRLYSARWYAVYAAIRWQI